MSAASPGVDIGASEQNHVLACPLATSANVLRTIASLIIAEVSRPNLDSSLDAPYASPAYAVVQSYRRVLRAMFFVTTLT